MKIRARKEKIRTAEHWNCKEIALVDEKVGYKSTGALYNGRKIWVAVIVVLIAIVCVIVLFFINKNGLVRTPIMLSFIGRNRIGEGTEQEGSGAFSLGSNDTVGNAVDMSKWDMTRVNVVADTEGVYVPVPKGFVASGATGEHTVNTGFVIYEGEESVDDSNAWEESCTRNQFVWVPVPDPTRVFEEIGTTGKKKAKLWAYNATGRTAISNGDTDKRREPGVLSRETKRILERYGMQGYTKERLFQELTTSFDREMETIKKYGGFYIGRYETGNVSNEQPVVQRMNTTIGDITWYAMYLRMKNISINKNVETNMIWGCLWDETMQWFIDTDVKTQVEIGSDSTEWGNYYNATFEYTNTSGGTSTKSASGYKSIPTGSTERNKANNIYDMAGNVSEWTMENDGLSYPYTRGGVLNDTFNRIYSGTTRMNYYIAHEYIPNSSGAGIRRVEKKNNPEVKYSYIRISCMFICQVDIL